MIDYSPFWETLEASEESWYTLTKKHKISDSTLHRLKHNKDVTMKTINDQMCIRDRTGFFPFMECCPGSL